MTDRRRHPYDLKLRAVSMVLDDGYTLPFVCAALDVPKSCLSKWVQLYRDGRLKPPRRPKKRVWLTKKGRQARAIEAVVRQWGMGAVCLD